MKKFIYCQDRHRQPNLRNRNERKWFCVGETSKKAADKLIHKTFIGKSIEYIGELDKLDWTYYNFKDYHVELHQIREI